MRLALISLLMIPLAVGCGGKDEEGPPVDERTEGTEAGDCNDDADNDGDIDKDDFIGKEAFLEKKK